MSGQLCRRSVSHSCQRATEEGRKSQPADRLQKHAKPVCGLQISAQRLFTLATDQASMVVGLADILTHNRLLHMPTPKPARLVASTW